MADVANQIGCAPTTVSRVVARDGLRRQSSHPPELDDPVWLAERLIERQQSLTSVAAELDVNRTAVTRARDRHGIKTTPVRRSRPPRRQLERRFRRLRSVAAIARSYDTSPDVAERCGWPKSGSSPRHRGCAKPTCEQRCARRPTAQQQHASSGPRSTGSTSNGSATTCSRASATSRYVKL